MTDRLAPPAFDPADAAAAAARFAATAAADVSYARVDSPIGTLVAARTERGLACLSYEDHHGGLDAVLDALAAGQQPKTGTQEPGRHTVEPLGGPTTLREMVTESHDYRGEW